MKNWVANITTSKRVDCVHERFTVERTRKVGESDAPRREKLIAFFDRAAATPPSEVSQIYWWSTTKSIRKHSTSSVASQYKQKRSWTQSRIARKTRSSSKRPRQEWCDCEEKKWREWTRDPSRRRRMMMMVSRRWKLINPTNICDICVDIILIYFTKIYNIQHTHRKQQPPSSWRRTTPPTKSSEFKLS